MSKNTLPTIPVIGDGEIAANNLMEKKLVDHMVENTLVRPLIVFGGGATFETAEDAFLGLNGVDLKGQVLEATVAQMSQPMTLFEGNVSEQTGFNTREDLINKAMQIARERDASNLTGHIEALRQSILFPSSGRDEAIAQARGELDKYVDIRDGTLILKDIGNTKVMPMGMFEVYTRVDSDDEGKLSRWVTSEVAEITGKKTEKPVVEVKKQEPKAGLVFGEEY